jgi:hypothetical protein
MSSLPPALASNRRGCTIGVLRRLIGVCTRLRLPSSWLAYIRHVRLFTAFLGRSPDTATPEDPRTQKIKALEE